MLPTTTSSFTALSEAAELLQPGFGQWAYAEFEKYNDLHFGNELIPCPMICVPVAPYGHWVGLARKHAGGAIYIQATGSTDALYGNTLKQSHIILHEMIHHLLFQQGRNSEHNATPWCAEIMRIGKEMGLPDFWASPSQPRKRDGRSVRMQKPRKDGMASISLNQIARFPHFAFTYQKGEAVLRSTIREAA